MDEYISIPTWIELDMIDSPRLIKFIVNAEYIDKDKISLDYLRKYYMENFIRGIDLIDELSLRGFEFYYLGFSDFIPDYRYKDSEELIINNGSKNKFINMNFNLIGLKDLVDRFNIKSDNFFNFIPISGFKAITQNPNHNLIKSEFSKAGFRILSANKAIDIINSDKNNNIQVYNSESISGVEKVDFDIDELKEQYTNLDKILIEVAFAENKYNVFRKYCYYHNKITLHDLNNEDILRLPLQRGIGEKRYAEIIKKLNEIKFNILLKDKGNISQYESMGLLITDIFNERKYKMFREFCKTKNIFHIGSIDEKVLIEFSNMKGIGKTRVKDVLNKLETLNIFLDLIKDNPIIDIDKFKIGQENFLKDLKINHIFSHPKFKIFRSYCSSNGISTVLDITNDDIINYRNYRGVGEKKYMEFIETLKLSIDNAMIERQLFSNDKFKISNEAYEKYKNIKLSTLANIFNIKGINNNLYIRDIQGKTYDEIIEDKTEEILDELTKLSTKLNTIKNIDEIVNIALSKLNDKESMTIIARFIENMTLEETGNILELTRERVRQIEKKALKKIQSIFNKYSLINSLKLMFNSNEFFYLKELEKSIDENNIFIINLIKEGKIKNLFYFKYLDLVFFYNIDKKVKLLNKELEQFPDHGLIPDFIENIEEIISNLFGINLEYNQVIRLLEEMGYKIYEYYFSKSKLSYTAILEILFKYHFKEPIRLDEVALDKFNKLTREIFNNDYVWIERNTDSKLRNIEEIILTDRKTFCHIDNLSNNIFLMNQIKSYIDSYLEVKEAINVEILFNEFKEPCLQNNIDNKVHLYSLIKYNFGEYYNTSFGNTLTFTMKNNREIKTVEERLNDFIINNGGIVKKNKIAECFQWKRSRIENIISNSEKLITFETNEMSSIDIIFKDINEIQEFNTIVSDSMDNGYSTANIIFNKMLFNPITFNLINRNGIKQSSTISNIIRKINPKISGHTNFLYYKDSKYKSIYDVIKEKFPERVNRREIYEFAILLGYSTSTANIILNNLIDNKYYKEISVDELVPTNKFIIDICIIQKLKDMILSEMGLEEYISLSGLKNYRTNLPNISFRWNPYVMRSILEDHGFKSIKRKNGDYRYDCIIIVKEESKINYFDELVYYILKYKYKGNLQEQLVYDYLVSLGLLRYQQDKYNQILPYEIAKSDLFYIDNIGRIELKDVNISFDGRSNQ